MKAKKLKEYVNSIPDECDVVIGDTDPMGRHDLEIEKVIKKKYGFDESNEQYYALVTKGVRGCCFI